MSETEALRSPIDEFMKLFAVSDTVRLTALQIWKTVEGRLRNIAKLEAVTAAIIFFAQRVTSSESQAKQEQKKLLEMMFYSNR